MRAIILAGGKGTRLRPYTTLIPKPLVPLGGETSVIEIIIKQLAQHGFKRVTVAVNHLSNLIKSYLGDGKKYKIKIDYSVEEKELGTIGPLTLIKDLPDNFLLMNGDILTDLNYKNFFTNHLKKKNLITLASCKRQTLVDFGTLVKDKEKLLNFIEKPKISYDVSMGIFCLNKKVLKKEKKNKFLNFDKFIINKIKYGVSTFQHHGLWLDIGRVDDYDLANENFKCLEKKILKKV